MEEGGEWRRGGGIVRLLGFLLRGNPAYRELPALSVKSPSKRIKSAVCNILLDYFRLVNDSLNSVITHVDRSGRSDTSQL